MHLTQNPAPTLSCTRSFCKKNSLPKAFAKDHICVCARNCNLSHKQAPFSNQNKPSQVKVKVTEQRSSPKSFLSFQRSVVVGHFPTVLREAKIPLISVKTSGKDCRTLPRIWQLWSSQSDTTASGIWKITSKMWLGLHNSGTITTLIKLVLFCI